MAVESADKNAVIDGVEILGQVDEYGCTVLSFIEIHILSQWCLNYVTLFEKRSTGSFTLRKKRLS
jgi:hypothetical protein